MKKNFYLVSEKVGTQWVDLFVITTLNSDRIGAIFKDVLSERYQPVTIEVTEHKVSMALITATTLTGNKIKYRLTNFVGYEK